MKNQKLLIPFAIAGLLGLLNACEQSKKTHPVGTQTQTMDVVSEECSAGIGVGEGSRGLFVLDTFENRTTGNVEVVARGFMTDKTFDTKATPPHYCVGLMAAPSDRRARPNCGAIPYSDLGPSILLKLGENSIEASAQIEPSAATLYQMVKPVTNPKSESHQTVPLRKRQYGIYYSDFKNPYTIPIDDVDAARAAKDKVQIGDGVQEVRSMFLDKMGGKDLNVALSVPYSVDADGNLASTIKGAIGKPLEIKVSPDPSPPADLAGEPVITVEVRENTSNGAATWAATCTTKDDGKEVINMATEWKDAEGNAHAMKAGNVWIAVKRRYLTATDVEGGGKLYFEMGAGALGYGQIAPKPKSAQ